MQAPGVSFIKVLFMFGNFSFKQLAHLTKHVKPRTTNIKNLIRVMEDKRGHLNVLPPLNLLLGEIFSDQREQGEDRESLCEQLLHQGDEL